MECGSVLKANFGRRVCIIEWKCMYHSPHSFNPPPLSSKSLNLCIVTVRREVLPENPPVEGAEMIPNDRFLLLLRTRALGTVLYWLAPRHKALSDFCLRLLSSGPPDFARAKLSGADSSPLGLSPL